MSTRDFAVVPPPAYALWTLLAVLLVPLTIMLAVAMREGRDALLAAVPAALSILAMGVGLVLALHRRRVRLDGGELRVEAALFKRSVPMADIDLGKSRIVNLAEHTELAPGLKTWGMGLPGFQAGWYLGRDRARRFCLLTDRARVLHLPLHSGGGLLLSLQQPQALLDALAATPVRR